MPDWGRIVGQMQFDTYHIFTVDEHTIEAVKVLNTLERGELAEIAPVASELVEHVQSRRALYVAMLLHDIAKGRGGDHSELGAELALEVGPALGLTAEETETVSWLVLHHLLLSQTAFKRDIDDPKTILDLADTIQSPERLRLLLILTVADMRAVSTQGVERLEGDAAARALRARRRGAGGRAGHHRTRCARGAGEAGGRRAADGLDARTKSSTSPRSAIAGYWLSFDPETHARHARLIRDAEHRKAPLTVDTQPLPARAVTEVTVYAADHRRAVQPDLRRAGGGRRLDRRCAHPYDDQRHGAGHVLDPGRRRRHVRRAAPAGAAVRADRAGAVGPAAAGP